MRQEFGHAENCVERGSDLVADRCHEFGFCAVARLGGLDRHPSVPGRSTSSWALAEFTILNWRMRLRISSAIESPSATTTPTETCCNRMVVSRASARAAETDAFVKVRNSSVVCRSLPSFLRTPESSGSVGFLPFWRASNSGSMPITVSRICRRREAKVALSRSTARTSCCRGSTAANRGYHSATRASS